MKIFYLLISFQFLCSCKSTLLLHPNCVNKTGDLNKVISSCSLFYDPFKAAYDSIQMFNENGLNTVKVNTIIDFYNGKYECYVNDTTKFLECDILKNKINGVCIEYFLPSGRDTCLYGKFRNNKLNGDYRRFGADGKLIIHEVYSKGKKIQTLSVPEAP